MPEIQTLVPKGDVDEDYRFIVRCDSTISVVTGHSLRFIWRGPYGRTDVSPSTIVDVSGSPFIAVTSVARKEITCTVSGFTLASGEYHGSLRKTDPGARATFARWSLNIRPDQTA